MLERILLYVEESEASKRLAAWALKFAKILNARIFALFVIKNSKAKSKRVQPKSNQEEDAWAILYEIEDEAFEENVKISLLLEESRPEDKIIEVLDSFKLDGMIISSQARLDIKELISRMVLGKVLIIK